MDAKDTVVSQVAIKDGRFARVGGLAKLAPGPCVVDLKGRTVVPGLIDNHNHFILLGERPGHDARLEEAFSVAGVQAAIKARAATVPAGGWVTAMGGWAPLQLAEKRMPTLSELDAADTAHPVLVYTSFSGPAAANSKAREFLAAHGVQVGADGAIAANAPSLAARKALLAIQTDADRERGVLDAMAYSASVGLTTNVDMGEFVEPGTRDMKDSFMAETLASGDPFKMYDPFLKLHREGKLTTRLRVFFLQMDQGTDFPADPRAGAEPVRPLRRRHDARVRRRRIRHFLVAVRQGRGAGQLRAGAQVHRRPRLGLPAAQPVAGRRPGDRRRLRGGQQDHADRGPALVRRPRAQDRRAHRDAAARRWAPASPCTPSSICPIPARPRARRCA